MQQYYTCNHINMQSICLFWHFSIHSHAHKCEAHYQKCNQSCSWQATWEEITGVFFTRTWTHTKKINTANIVLLKNAHREGTEHTDSANTPLTKSPAWMRGCRMNELSIGNSWICYEHNGAINSFGGCQQLTSHICILQIMAFVKCEVHWHTVWPKNKPKAGKKTC